MYITTPDKISRELGIIRTIFEAQYKKYDCSETFPYLLNSEGTSGIDGRYINWMNVYSNVELLNLQSYKKELTERFEKTNNHSLLRNQLKEIRGKATSNMDYYNNNLTDKSKIVKDFLSKKNQYSFSETTVLVERHSAIVTTSDYRIGEIYLGCNNIDKENILRRYEHTFNYLSNNYQFAIFCEKLVDFIDNFSLLGATKTEQNEIEKITTIIDKSSIEIADNPEYYQILIKHFDKSKDKQRENRRTFLIIEKFNDKSEPHYHAETQHETGQSNSTKSTGTADFAIYSQNEIKIKGEAVNFRGLNSNKLGADLVFHLKKLIKNYNRTAINDLFFLVYYEGKKNCFFKSFKNYKSRLNKSKEIEFTCLEVIDNTLEFETTSSSIKIAKSIHSYSNDSKNQFNIYHFYIDFSEE